MGAGMRQWKALMRKNFITWKRNTGCSVCEIACPSAMMFLMLVLRNIIDVDTFTFSDITSASIPVFPGLSYTYNLCDPAVETCTTGQKMKYGYWSTAQLDDINYNVEPFFDWLKYPNGWKDMDDETREYHLSTDWKGPLYFVPTQCMEANSF